MAGSESAEAIPDFSGIWVHALPGFEPLPSGPTALVNRSRRENGTGDILKLAGDYTNPILKPQAAEVVKKHGELGLNGIGDPNPRNQCWPIGVPFVFTNGPTQLLQQPDRVTILYGYDHQVRRVPLNQSHPAQVAPSWYGDSVGHYEGDTLVIDTVGFKVGRYSMIDWYGTPHTEALHVVERYRLLDPEAAKEGFDRDAKQHNVAMGKPNAGGKFLQLQFTVEDKNVFTTPWTATMTYRIEAPTNGTSRLVPKTSCGTRERKPTCRGRTSRISEARKTYEGGLAASGTGQILPLFAARNSPSAGADMVRESSPLGKPSILLSGRPASPCARPSPAPPCPGSAAPRRAP